jgi:hypothetical protein
VSSVVACNLVDVRSTEEFTGQVIAPTGMNESAQRGGHVPGAKSIPWSLPVAPDGTFKSADELRRIYLEQKGVDPNRPTITYCRIGEVSVSRVALKVAAVRCICRTAPAPHCLLVASPRQQPRCRGLLPFPNCAPATEGDNHGRSTLLFALLTPPNQVPFCLTGLRGRLRMSGRGHAGGPPEGTNAVLGG